MTTLGGVVINLTIQKVRHSSHHHMEHTPCHHKVIHGMVGITNGNLREIIIISY